MKFKSIQSILLVLCVAIVLSACSSAKPSSSGGGEASAETAMYPDIDNMLDDYDGDVSISKEHAVADVAAIIRKLDKRFRLDDYYVDVYDHNDESSTIDFMRVIGAFEMDSGYMASILSGKLDILTDHTKEISKKEIKKLRTLSDRLGVSFQPEAERTVPIEPVNGEERPSEPKELAEALQLALEQTNASPGKEAKQQRYYYYYDLESKTASILVYTEYYLDETEATSVDVYTYPLEY